MDVRPLKGKIAVAAALVAPLRVTSGPLAVTFGRHTDRSSDSLGYVVTASKRVARRAVMRNRIKRLLREAVRRTVRRHATACADAGLSTMIAIWRSAPAEPMMLRLADVEPHVESVFLRAIAATTAPPSNAPRS